MTAMWTDRGVLECKVAYICWLEPKKTAGLQEGQYKVKVLKEEQGSCRCETWWDQLERNVISILPSVRALCSHHSLGSRPTKQLASMGIPALLSNKSLPPFPISLPLWVSCSWPQERGGQVYFLRGGPFGVAARALPHCRWCIRWGSPRSRRRDSFITAALNLTVAVQR